MNSWSLPRPSVRDGLLLVLIVALSIYAGMWIEWVRSPRPYPGTFLNQWVGSDGKVNTEFVTWMVLKPGEPMPKSKMKVQTFDFSERALQAIRRDLNVPAPPPRLGRD